MKTAEEYSDDVVELWSKFDWDEINFNQFKNYVKNYIEQAKKEAFKEGQSNPKIKQLEWEDKSPTAQCGFGEYYYYKDLRTGLHHAYINGMFICEKLSLDEAMDDCQEDYERRVKECLEL